MNGHDAFFGGEAVSKGLKPVHAEALARAAKPALGRRTRAKVAAQRYAETALRARGPKGGEPGGLLTRGVKDVRDARQQLSQVGQYKTNVSPKKVLP